MSAIARTPLGPVCVSAGPAGVSAVSYLPPDASVDDHRPVAAEADAAAQIEEFFAGRRARFDVVIDWDAVSTPFARAVLAHTARIPAGQTRTYKQIAQLIGRPAATRAVGSALRRNPLPLLIPCHRVVRGDGTLGAYSGRVDDRKRLLLGADLAAVAA